MVHNEEMTFEEAWQQLETELEVAKPPLFDANETMVPLKAIKTAAAVFQPRGFDVQEAASSEDHVQNLMAAIQNSPNHLLDPITVWWSGSCYRVLDGHHRTSAYERVNKLFKAGKKKKAITTIPVNIFVGTLGEALRKSGELNARDKLPMTKDDKLNMAWKMVIKGAGSKRDIHRSTTISEGTISSMRVRLKTLQDHFKVNWEGACLAMTWKEAFSLNKKEKDYGEEWQHKQADVWAKRLGNAFGKKFSQQPDIAAMALALYSDKLPESLMEIWGNRLEDDLDPEF